MKTGISVSVIQRGKSGVASYIAGLLRGMEAEGWPADVTLFGLAEDRDWFARWLDRCEWVAIPENFRPAVKNIAWHQTVLPGLLRRHGCDLIHIPSYRRIVALPGRPQVVTIHDLAPFRLAGKYDRMRMLYGRHAVKWLVRRAREIIAVSETTAADIREFFGTGSDRLSVVYNGIDHERFRPLPPDEVRRRLPVTADWKDNWWIYVARLEHPAKNHLRLIKAFERLRAEAPLTAGRLVLAGADWHGAAEIHSAVARSPARDWIHMAGFVPDDEMPAWYSGAKGLVFPSLFEGFGFPPIEAMACGCPVLSSDRGSLCEVVGSAAHIFDPENPAAIAAAMFEVSHSGKRRDELREAGFARAGQFRWERCARETISLYRRALKG